MGVPYEKNVSSKGHVFLFHDFNLVFEFVFKFDAMGFGVEARHAAGVHEDDLPAQFDFLFFDHRQDAGKHLARVARVEEDAFVTGHGVNGFADPRFRFVVALADIARFDVEVAVEIKAIFFLGLLKVGL